MVLITEYDPIHTIVMLHPRVFEGFYSQQYNQQYDSVGTKVGPC